MLLLLLILKHFRLYMGMSAWLSVMDNTYFMSSDSRELFLFFSGFLWSFYVLGFFLEVSSSQTFSEQMRNRKVESLK